MELGIGVIIGGVVGVVLGHAWTMWRQVEPMRQERDLLSKLCAYWQGTALELENRRVRVRVKHGTDATEVSK